MTPPAVLNTRPRAQAAELSRLLQHAGFEAVEAPAIEVASAWEPADLEDVRRDLVEGAFDWVVLPSQNAGAAVSDVLVGSTVVCGSQTARALGLQPTHRLDRFSASAALDVLRPLIVPGQRVLIPRAAEGRDDWLDDLVALGASVHAPIAYRTVAVDPAVLRAAGERLLEGQIDTVTLCSPSAFQSMLSAFGRAALAGVPLLCLGETTADAVRRAGLEVAGIAEKTSMRSLVEAVADTLAERSPREVPA
jgi:uroporphyrinogen-III synthase